MDIREKLPLINSNSKVTRIVGYVIYLLAAFFILIVIIPAPNTIQNEEDNRTSTEWVEQGKFFFHNGNWPDSFKAFEKATKVDPNNAEAWYWTAEVLSVEDINWNKNGVDWDKVIKALNKAIEINPYNITYRDNKAFALRESGKYDEALECYDEILKLSPNYYPALIYKAEILGLDKNDYEAALKELDRAIEINPNARWAWARKSEFLYEIGRFEESDNAEAVYRRLDNQINVYAPLTPADITRIKQLYEYGFTPYGIAEDLLHSNSEAIEHEIQRMIASGELKPRK